eukprot:1141382-Pelagomonas_calceolata.AAC.4
MPTTKSSAREGMHDTSAQKTIQQTGFVRQSQPATAYKTRQQKNTIEQILPDLRQPANKICLTIQLQDLQYRITKHISTISAIKQAV